MKKLLYFNAVASLCLVALMHTIAIAQLAKPWTDNPWLMNAAPYAELSTSLSNNYNYNLNASLELRNPYVPIGIKAGGTYYNDTQASETFTHQSVIQGSSYALPIYIFGLPNKILISDSNKRPGYYSRAAGRASRKRSKASPCLRLFREGSVFNDLLRGLYVSPEYAIQKQTITSTYIPEELDYTAVNTIFTRTVSVIGGYSIAIENLAIGVSFGIKLKKQNLTDSTLSENTTIAERLAITTPDTSWSVSLGICF